MNISREGDSTASLGSLGQAPSPSEGRSSSSCSAGTSPASVCAHCPLSCHWASLERAWPHKWEDAQHRAGCRDVGSSPARSPAASAAAGWQKHGSATARGACPGSAPTRLHSLPRPSSQPLLLPPSLVPARDPREARSCLLGSHHPRCPDRKREPGGHRQTDGPPPPHLPARRDHPGRRTVAVQADSWHG